MIGAPTETEEEMFGTYKFMQENIVDGGLGTSAVIPFPGTGLWKWCLENKKIPSNVSVSTKQRIVLLGEGLKAMDSFMCSLSKLCNVADVEAGEYFKDYIGIIMYAQQAHFNIIAALFPKIKH